MVKEHMAQSPSVVCIHMNVDNKSQPCGKEKFCKFHNCCRSNPALTPYLSKKRKESKLRRKHTNLSRSRIASRSRSSESLSSDGSKGVVWEPDIENSKPKESSSNSTSTSVSRDKRTATHRPGILREDQLHSPAVRPKSRTRHTGTRSHGRHSRSTSDSVSSLDSRGESTRHKKSKLRRQSLDTRKTSHANHRKHHKGDHLSAKPAKHKTLSRNKSPAASSRSTSRSYSDSDVSSITLESDFVPESRSKKSRREPRHLPKKVQSESEYSTDGDRESQYVETYSHNTLCRPEVHSVELINTIGIVNEGCAQCSCGRGHTVCVCQPSTNRHQTSPACLMCSHCHAIPSSNTSCQKRRHIRDEHSHRKTSRHKSGRTKSPEKRKGHGHSKHSHEKREVDETCLYSCNCADCVSKNRSQFYQCNLLLGQCCTPIRQCLVFHRDNQCNKTRNRRESQCTLNENQLSDTPASQLSSTPTSQLSDD